MKEETYIIVVWPEIQDLVGLEGFAKNTHLINDDQGVEEHGSSAYFVKQVWYEREMRWISDQQDAYEEYVEGYGGGTD